MRHINPTVNFMPRLFRDHFNGTQFYGPGFQPESVLNKGLISFVEANGPFDFIVVGHNTPIMVDGRDPLKRAISFQDRATAHSLSSNLRLRYFEDIRSNLNHAGVQYKLVSAINFDYYATTQEQIDNLVSRDCLIIGANEQFVTSMEELPEFAKKERHYARNNGRFSDAWYHYLESNRAKVVTALHFVDGTEIFADPLDGRKYDISVPGAEYYLRKQAILGLSRSQMKQASKIYYHLFRLGNFLGVPTYSSELFLHLYNALFMQSMRNTKCVYSAKGGFGIPVRKFFEIPASGALLLCSPPKGYKALGFINNENYVFVEPAEIADALDCWLNRSDAQIVASAGQRLVAENHSLKARAGQIRRCFEALLDGSYKGSRWESGEFRLI